MNKIYLILALLLISCGKSGREIYIGLEKQAIVSCNGSFHPDLEISCGNEWINLEGAWPNVYFNQPIKAMSIAVNGKRKDSFFFKLKPSSAYEIIKSNSADRGLIIVSFETDSMGRVVTTSSPDCD